MFICFKVNLLFFSKVYQEVQNILLGVLTLDFKIPYTTHSVVNFFHCLSKCFSISVKETKIITPTGPSPSKLSFKFLSKTANLEKVHFLRIPVIEKTFAKELTLCHKLWFSNPNIFGTQCRKPLIFQTYIFWSNKSHSLKYQRFTTLESKDIGIRKSEFDANSQFLLK